MIDKTVWTPVDKEPASRPGIISYVVMGVVIAAGVFFIFLN